jgi:outer membrane protein assembly factor BamB
MRLHVIHVTALIALVAGPAAANDFETLRPRNWHQWRGPNADGVAPHGDPPVEWSEESNLRWKVAVPGSGSASPIVWQDRIFVLTAVPTDQAGDKAAAAPEADAPAAEQEPRRGRRPGGFGGGRAPTNVHQFTILCLDRETGRTLWEQVANAEVPHEGGHQTNTFASGSPTTDGRFVYASFGSRGIFCYDMEGNLQWERDLGDMRTRNAFGEGASPKLEGDTLLVPWDQEEQSALYALDARTGETRWQVDRDEATTWATPLVVEHDGRRQIVMNGRRARGYDFESGDLLWECGGQASNPIACPITHEGLVYCMTGHQGNAVFAIPLGAAGNITGTADVAWQRTDTGPYIASPVLYGGILYVTKSRDAALSRLDPRTGAPLDGLTRLPGLGTLYASPVAAADRLYYTDRDGTTLVIAHGAELKVLTTNKLGEGIDASPAIVGKQMFLRGARHLYCVEAR